MIQKERMNRYDEWDRRRFPLRRLAERAGGMIERARERLFGKEVEAIFGLPLRQERLIRYLTPELFSYLDTPPGLNLYEISQELIKQTKERGGGYDPKHDSHRRMNGRVVIRTDHASDLAIPGILNYDERATVITGSELLLGRVMGGGTDHEFTKLIYKGKEIPLVDKNGNTNLLHGVLDELGENPIPEGSVLEFESQQHTLEVTVLPIPSEFKVPQLSFIGASERSNLDRNLRDAKVNGGRILVVFKDGQQGLVNAFAQSSPEAGVDVFELFDAEKKTVKSVNGTPATTRALPPIEPGKAQIVLLPIKGKIEGYIRDQTEAMLKGTPPTTIHDMYGAFGIDVIESGSSASQVGVVPVDFRRDGSHHIKASAILDWYKNNRPQYLEYVRENAIMPIQPIAIRVRKRQAA